MVKVSKKLVYIKIASILKYKRKENLEMSDMGLNLLNYIHCESYRVRERVCFVKIYLKKFEFWCLTLLLAKSGCKIFLLWDAPAQ